MLGRIKRMLKHRWQVATRLQRVITPALLERLGQRVQASERRHSGEIRIYVEAGLPQRYLWSDAPTRALTRQRALSVFGQLGVWDTANNNGVLIYLLLAEHAIELVADRGLNDVVPAPVWASLVDGMGKAFRQQHFEEGLTQALEQLSTLLEQHFALAPGAANPNELPDVPRVHGAAID